MTQPTSQHEATLGAEEPLQVAPREAASDQTAPPLTTSERLDALSAAAEATGEKVSFGWILDQMHERAFGFFLLILALPCCIPMLYGVPQVVALPMLMISWQLVLGRRSLWLPDWLLSREVSAATLKDLSRRARPWLARIERLTRPRLAFITRPPADRLVGVGLLICAASILAPLPSTNTAPGIGVALAALGLLERDGLLVTIGVLFGLIWVATLVVLAVALIRVLVG